MPLILEDEKSLEPDNSGLKHLDALGTRVERLAFDRRDYILANPTFGSFVFQQTDKYASERNVFSVLRFRPSDTQSVLQSWIDDRLFDLRAAGADLKRLEFAGLKVVPPRDGEEESEYLACWVTPGRQSKDQPGLTAPRLRGLVVNDDYLKARRQPGSDFKPNKKT
jgi:hypothetical protein